MGIIIHDELKTETGVSVKDYYGSFSDGIKILKVREITSQEVSENEFDSEKGWSQDETVLDASNNVIFDVDASGNRTRRMVTKYYKFVETFKYNISAMFNSYVSKDIRIKSKIRNIFKDDKSVRYRQSYDNYQRFRKISSLSVDGFYDDCDNVYEKLYTKLKSMNVITNYTDDL